jgi:hypothetical protein
VIRTCDAVLAQPASGVLPAADLRRLKAASPRLLNLPAILFAGYHPDAIYVADGKTQLIGPTQALHSRIAVCAFLSGLNVAETTMLYNRMVFGRLGYLSEFGIQAALLAERFGSFGIDLQPALRDWAASGCFMHSPNHPKAAPLLDLARIACRLLNLEPEPDPATQPDTLQDMPSHPVYPDLADSLGVPPEHVFRAPARGGQPRELDFDQFLEASFAVYRKANRAELSMADGVAEASHALGLKAVARSAK